MSSRSTRCLFLVATLAISAPLVAQPTPSTSSVSFQYSAGNPNNASQTITFSGGTITSARISQNIDQNGNQVTAASPGSAAGVFVFNSISGELNVALDSNVLAPLAQKGQNTYTGKLLASYTGCLDCISITLNLQIGNNGQITVSPASITLSSVIGGSATATFQVSTLSAVPISFQMTSSQAWLTLSQTGGTTGMIGGSAGSATITVVANAAVSGVQVGTNSATVTIVTSVGSPTVPVTFNVGTGNTLTLSQSTLSFSYATTTQTYTPSNPQYVTVSGPTAGSTFTATANSTNSWLAIGTSGQTTYNGIIGSAASPATIPILVNATLLGNPPANGNYNGTISFSTTSGAALSATLSVTLTVSGTSTGGTALTFSVATAGSAAPAAQSYNFSGNGSYFIAASTNMGGSWLSATPTFVTLSGNTVTVTVSVTPSPNGVALPAGTYTGQVTITQAGSVIQTTSVTMNIGGSTAGGQIVSPTSLTFNVSPGGSQTQYVIVNGANGSNFIASAFGAGISVSPIGGATPAVVGISVNANSAGIITGSNLGYVNITSGGVSATVNVNLNVLNGAVLTANPAAYATQYTPGQTSNLLPNMSVTSSTDSAGQNLTFSIQAPAFITLNTSSGTTPTTIGVALNPSGLQPGLNSGNIVITSTNAADNPLNIPVTILAPGTTQGMTLTPSSLALTGTSGGAAVTQSVSVSGLAGTSFTAAASILLANGQAGNWLSVSPTVGTSPGTLTVSANPGSLLAGTTYTGTVTITPSTGPATILNVSFTVNAQSTTSPNLAVSTNSVTFNYRPGDPAPAPQTVNVSSTGGNVNFSVTTGTSWITVSPASGTTPGGSFTIAVDPSKLGSGTQQGTVTVTAAGATGSPQTIQVTLNISAPPTLTVPGNSIGFSYTQGGGNPAPQTVQVSSTGAALAFTVSVSNAPWLTVSPTSGTTPAVLTFTADPTKVASVGNYTATVFLNASGSSQSITVTLTTAAPLPTVTAVYNGASFQQGAIAPGEIIYITGTGMGPDPLVTLTTTGDIVNSLLSATRVLVGGFAAPIVYTSSTQVAAVVPYELAGKVSSFLQVEYQGQRSNSYSTQVASSAPGIFTLNSSGSGPGAILNQDNSVNSDANPAAPDSVIVVFATGEGQTLPGGINGKLADDPTGLPKPILPVTATINNEPADVLYAGAAPGLVAGVLQVNIRVPADARSGDVVIRVGSNPSQGGVTVAIK